MLVGRIKRAAAAAVIVSSFASPVLAQSGPQLAAAGQCPTQTALQAAQVRVLQTELMVAALQCRNDPAFDHSAKYNAFISQFSSSLSQHGKALQDHFRKAFGGDHQRQLDRYVTRLANDAGQRGTTTGYCQTMAPLFERVLTLKKSDLGSFSSELPLGQAVLRDKC